jgi:hypothetical protein
MTRHPSLLVTGWTVGTVCLFTKSMWFQSWGALMIVTALVLFLFFPSRPVERGGTYRAAITPNPK